MSNTLSLSYDSLFDPCWYPYSGNITLNVDTNNYKSIADALSRAQHCNAKIKDVIFNAPATIILWDDNTKTVVKAQNDEPYDPEKGLAMAIVKKLYGNKGNYNEIFKKWLKKAETISE